MERSVRCWLLVAAVVLAGVIFDRCAGLGTATAPGVGVGGAVRAPAVRAHDGRLAHTDAPSSERAREGAPPEQVRRSAGGSAELTVVSSDGSPVRGASVHAASASGVACAVTDGRGRATVPALPGVFLVQHEHHAPVLRRVDAVPSPELVLERAGSLKVAIEDGRGRPLENVRLALCPPGLGGATTFDARLARARRERLDELAAALVDQRLSAAAVERWLVELRAPAAEWGPDALAVSDARGRLRWPLVAAADGYRLQLLSRHWLDGLEFEQCGEPFAVRPDSLTEVRLLARDAGTLAGRVVLADGSPGAGARIVLRRHQHGGVGPGGVYSPDNEGHHFERELEADADGLFRFRDVLPGSKSINATLWREDAAELALWHARMDVEAYGQSEVGTLWPVGETWRARAGFVDESGAAVAARRVLHTACGACGSAPSAADTSGSTPLAHSGLAGAARTLGPGALGPGAGGQEAGGQEATGPGSACPRCAATVPLPRVSVHLLQFAQPISVSFSVPLDVPFRVVGLARGPLRVHAREALLGWRLRAPWTLLEAMPWQRELTLPSAGDARLALRVASSCEVLLEGLPPAQELEGLPPAQEAGRLRVDVVAIDGSFSSREVFDADEPVRLLLPRGDYLAYCLLERGGDRLCATTSGRVAEPSQRWGLALRPATTLAGIVVGRDGEPRAHQVIKLAPLELAARSCYPVRVRADAAGRFEAHGLPQDVELAVYGAAGSFQAGDNVRVVLER